MLIHSYKAVRYKYGWEKDESKCSQNEQDVYKYIYESDIELKKLYTFEEFYRRINLDYGKSDCLNMSETDNNGYYWKIEHHELKV